LTIVSIEQARTTVLAMYVDLENLPKGVDFDRLMERAAGGTTKHVYAVKAAYGSAAALSKQYREQLLDHNFLIVDTPHVANKKNRADLMISVDAFERFHINLPSIDRFVFVTSDSDFSVIMDKLRIYGKQVWMVCRKTDQAKKILSCCCDRILSVEDFIPPPPVPPPASSPKPPLPATPPPKPPKIDVEKDRLAERLFKEALYHIGSGNLPVGLSAVGMQMRKLHQGFDFKRTRFKKLTALAVHFENTGVVRLTNNARGPIQIVDVDDSNLDDGDGSSENFDRQIEDMQEKSD
jgi:hypothetical protein